MKKILSIMLAIILNLNIALGYTSTILIKGVSIKVTGEEGSIVNIRSKLPEATGWEVKTNNITVNANGEFIMPAEDVIIEAIIPDALTYLLTIGNEYFDRRENKPAGEIVTVEADSSDGSFVFVSWTVEGIELTESQKVSEAITFTMPENEVTLIANYIEAGQEYTVTFDANGGSGTMAPQTFVVGTPQNLTQNTFTNTGKTFAGWSTTQNAITNELTDGQSYSGTGNITLYAVWITDAYTITYDLDGGTVTGNPGTYNVDTETITLINPTKDGYTFTGWTGSNGNTPSTTVTIPKGSTGNKEYIANWEINNYTITFNKNDGTNTTTTQEFEPNETKNLTLNTFTREGYNFKGWSTNSTATEETYTDGHSYTATSNIILYAVWGAGSVNITVNMANPGGTWYNMALINATTGEKIAGTDNAYGLDINISGQYSFTIGEQLKVQLSNTDLGSGVYLHYNSILVDTTYTFTVERNVTMEINDGTDLMPAHCYITH